MGEVIEHVPLDAIDAVLDAAKRLLRPDGLILLTTPNPHYLLLRLRSGGTVLGGAHVSLHCPKALSQYLRYVGFVVEVLAGSGRVSARVGTRLPMFAYGSYLIVARLGDA
jgi:2-polyprenyl-3-methyl-5-hydroxy-6-metoxy-1,4-benzoquinol methylase